MRQKRSSYICATLARLASKRRHQWLQRLGVVQAQELQVRDPQARLLDRR